MQASTAPLLSVRIVFGYGNRKPTNGFTFFNVYYLYYKENLKSQDIVASAVET